MLDRLSVACWFAGLVVLFVGGCDESGTLGVRPDVWPPADDDDLLDDDDSGGDDDDSGPFYDCASAPTTAGAEVIIPGAQGYHGLAIDASGLIVGSDGWSLIRSDYAGNWSVWMPNAGAAEQMTYLDNGDLIYASANTGGIHRITPEGGQSQVASGLSSYGVIIGPDGNIWTFLGRGDWARDETDTLVRIDGKGHVEPVCRLKQLGDFIFVGNDMYLTGTDQLRRIRGLVR